MQALYQSTPQMLVCQQQGRTPVPQIGLSGGALPHRSVRHLTRRATAGAAAARNATWVVRAAQEQTQAPTSPAPAPPSPPSANEPDWVPVCLPEELPKGVRKEVSVDGQQVLLFWYRNQIYCIQARSPAEGAYSEGFIKAKFTQDYCIECPSTGSLFSLNDGSIKAWYPNNTVLRALTPQSTCPNMEIFPVKLAQEAIYVDVSGAQFGGSKYANKGGANTSLENNNVFAVQPTVYFDGMDPAEERATPLMQPNEKQATNPAIIILGVALVAAVITVGYAVVKFIQLP
ncbi:rieske [2Fe-2S] protein [Dunaliella salina]|uniref:Rieske [2Fe-2S] protein n=1 Tax=Dunaliella salina TaxID=3046 RepID=A0ABQ7FZ88_DUNSA|nr:rieske [2Fe-2S] protein [Dunaliella salina]|eukprot:KAF5827672.1 rieske [2Fe-2S] protein [Dunaliella salina]